MSLKKAFGKRLKEIRQQKKLTQFQLAELANVDEKYIRHIERGGSFPRADLLEKFAEILDIDISEFFELKAFKDKKQLISEILNKLNNSSEKEIRYFYKLIMEY
ncbi:helix-turn-helix transcriptional regulator [bacterium]|nr:helix-turn-helix transcriptional regulator [bacterium]